MQILSYFPGQKVTIFLETVDINNIRTDSVSIPVVTRVIFPEFTLASSYPQDMIQLDIGLYYYQFTLPVGAVSIGSYLIDVSFINPANGNSNNEIYQVIVNAPFGNFGTTIG